MPDPDSNASQTPSPERPTPELASTPAERGEDAGCKEGWAKNAQALIAAGHNNPPSLPVEIFNRFKADFPILLPEP